jgi:hypothetical protein
MKLNLFWIAVTLALATIAVCIVVASTSGGREGFGASPTIVHGYPEIMEVLSSIDCDGYSRDKRIPRIIYRTFSKPYEELPEEAIAAMQSSVSLDSEDPYVVLYFSEEDCRQFIRQHFDKYIDDYDIVLPGAYRADLWRLLVLYAYGGVYSDLGQVYAAPVDSVVDHDADELVLVEDPPFPDCDMNGIFNAFMASHPRHPVIAHMISWVVGNIRNREYGKCCLDITGPTAIARAFNAYFGKDEDAAIEAGEYQMQGHRVKILIHVPRTILYNGEKLLDAKFPNYYEIIYPSNSMPHYSVIYDQKNVFGETL